MLSGLKVTHVLKQTKLLAGTRRGQILLKIITF